MTLDKQAISDEAEGAWDQAREDPEFRAEMKEIAKVYDVDRCIVCGDPLDPKQHRLECDG